jgi:hypothetical protein
MFNLRIDFGRPRVISRLAPVPSAVAASLYSAISTLSFLAGGGITRMGRRRGSDPSPKCGPAPARGAAGLPEAASDTPPDTGTLPSTPTHAAAAPASPPVSTKTKRPRVVAPSLSVQTSLKQLEPKALRIAEHLARMYPDPPIPLNHGSNFQLLCAVILSAQVIIREQGV